MALNVEGVVDGGVHAEKALCGASRFESLHLVLSSSHRLMRIFGSIAVGDVEPPLGEEFLNIPITQREAQVEPDRMLDDHRRKAVAAVRDFGHRTSLPWALSPGYPVKLTKPPAAEATISAGDHVLAPEDLPEVGSRFGADSQPVRA
jgi:hypothetical protein